MKSVLTIVCLLLATCSLAGEGPQPALPRPGGFQYFVGVVGNPSVPDIRWDDEELEQIKSLGVNMVQLSIAWGHKPADEVLNLEDSMPNSGKNSPWSSSGSKRC